MSRSVRRRIFLLLATAGLCLVSSQEALGSSLVVSSSGPSEERYPPGTILAEPLDIDLRSGDTVTVVDEAGTRVFRGPAKIRGGPKREAPSSVLQTLSLLKRSMTERRSRLGAARSYPGGKTPSEAAEQVPPEAAPSAAQEQLWDIDPSVGGDWCVPDLDGIELWRRDASKGEEFLLTGSAGNTAVIRWGKGEQSMFWPGNIQPIDHGRYFVQSQRSEGLYITLHRIAFDSDMVALAKQLEDNACDAQFALLLGNTG